MFPTFLSGTFLFWDVFGTFSGRSLCQNCIKIIIKEVKRMYISYNANPEEKRVGDCTVRAISTALNQPWETTYAGVAVEGMRLLDMPSANAVWGAYLRRHGFVREVIPNTCPDCYTVADFCREHPKGTFILALSGHVVAVIDGKYFDTWDSGGEIPIYFWHRKED